MMSHDDSSLWSTVRPWKDSFRGGHGLYCYGHHGIFPWHLFAMVAFLPWLPCLFSSLVVMAPMSFFHAETFNIGRWTSQVTTQKTATWPSPFNDEHFTMCCASLNRGLSSNPCRVMNMQPIVLIWFDWQRIGYFRLHHCEVCLLYSWLGILNQISLENNEESNTWGDKLHNINRCMSSTYTRLSRQCACTMWHASHQPEMKFSTAQSGATQSVTVSWLFVNIMWHAPRALFPPMLWCPTLLGPLYNAAQHYTVLSAPPFVVLTWHCNPMCGCASAVLPIPTPYPWSECGDKASLQCPRVQ